jgi:hypothetical protein
MCEAIDAAVGLFYDDLAEAAARAGRIGLLIPHLTGICATPGEPMKGDVEDIGGFLVEPPPPPR